MKQDFLSMDYESQFQPTSAISGNNDGAPVHTMGKKQIAMVADWFGLDYLMHSAQKTR